MRIKPYETQASPVNMIPDAFNSAPDFTLGAGKIFGFETPFYIGGTTLNAAARADKGITLFNNTDSSSLLRGQTMYDPEAVLNFGSNAEAYAYGLDKASDFKYIFGDFEGVYGNVSNFTTRDRISRFGKGMIDGGSYFGQWIDAMRYFTDVQVWESIATDFYNMPFSSGIGAQEVSLGGVLHNYLNMNIVIGYGVDISRTGGNLDPEAALYNYIHRFRAITRMKQVGLIPQVQKQVGFLAGYCDAFNNNVPNARLRTYLDSPYNAGSYIWQETFTEESLAQMESYAIYGMLEGDGVWYWKAPGIAVSDEKNDSIDILYSGFSLSFCGFSGSPSPPTPFGTGGGNRPTPNRIYNYIDGLSMENQFTGAHKISQITSILDGGTKTDSPYSYKRPTGSWIAVTKPINGYGIVQDYQGRRPIVTKVVKNNQVAFVCTDPGAANYSATKIRLSHAGKSWLVTMQDQRTEIFTFNF